MSKLTTQQIRSEALKYRMWSYGESVEWNCTTAEMARAVGCSRQVVNTAARERGWNLKRSIYRKKKSEGIIEVDTMMED